MRHLVLIAHNLRSCHNVGSLLRTADGLGLKSVYLTGYTPYPASDHDSRLPHEAARVDARINKTALGAQNYVQWRHEVDINKIIDQLMADGYAIAALEQSPTAIDLPSYDGPPKTALIVGREIQGLEPEVLSRSHVILQIPMLGRKESFNVVQAAAMALYHLRFN